MELNISFFLKHKHLFLHMYLRQASGRWHCTHEPYYSALNAPTLNCPQILKMLFVKIVLFPALIPQLK